MVGRYRLGTVDVAMRVVVRLVVDDAWSAIEAARQLRERVPDESVLRRARARVIRALAERAGLFGQRAVATIDAALALGPTHVVGVAVGES